MLQPTSPMGRNYLAGIVSIPNRDLSMLQPDSFQGKVIKLFVSIPNRDLSMLQLSLGI